MKNKAKQWRFFFSFILIEVNLGFWKGVGSVFTILSSFDLFGNLQNKEGLDF